MNIGNVGSSIEGQIAMLALETQAHEKEFERAERTAAREDLRSAIARDVDALKEQADAQLRGAIVEGALSIAGSALSGWGATKECDKPTWQSVTGKGLSELAKPIGGLAGHTYAAADAKNAQGAEEDAKSRIDDAKSAISSADAAQSNALEFLRSVARSDSATNVAILSNLA